VLFQGRIGLFLDPNELHTVRTGINLDTT